MFKPCSAQLYFQSTQNFVTVKTKSIFSQGHIIVVFRLWDHTVASVGLCQDHFQPSNTSILKLLRESHLCLMVLWVISMGILVYSTTKKDHAWILVPCFAQIPCALPCCLLILLKTKLWLRLSFVNEIIFRAKVWHTLICFVSKFQCK